MLLCELPNVNRQYTLTMNIHPYSRRWRYDFNKCKISNSFTNLNSDGEHNNNSMPNLEGSWKQTKRDWLISIHCSFFLHGNLRYWLFLMHSFNFNFNIARSHDGHSCNQANSIKKYFDTCQRSFHQKHISKHWWLLARLYFFSFLCCVKLMLLGYKALSPAIITVLSRTQTLRAILTIN